ncbi:hypothetical protein GCM10027019_05360 [Melaminivora jejuensis]
MGAISGAANASVAAAAVSRRAVREARLAGTVETRRDRGEDRDKDTGQDSFLELSGFV